MCSRWLERSDVRRGGCRSPLCSRAPLPGVKSTATENMKTDTFRTDLLLAKCYMRYIINLLQTSLHEHARSAPSGGLWTNPTLDGSIELL